MAKCVITIDGPAASGKSTAARLLAKKLGAVFLDTGAMYRAVTLAAMQSGVDLENDELVAEVLDKNCFSFEADKDIMIVSINGRYVTEQLRDIEVTANAKYISASKKVRQRLVKMQREFAENHGIIVTEGRDQGTIAFPDADVKFFLTAELDERARRRQADLSAKGINESFESVKKAIEERDKSDRSRIVGPLKPADDAITIDTTGLSIEQMIDKLLEIIKSKCSKKK